MSDKYDAEIERLVGHSFGHLDSAWDLPTCLFEVCGPEPLIGQQSDDGCGCLTQVRYGSAQASCAALTSAIRRDYRLPYLHYEVAGDWDLATEPERRAALQPFAEWQRALDATIRAGKPWHDDFTPRRTPDVPDPTPETAKCHL